MKTTFVLLAAIASLSLSACLPSEDGNTESPPADGGGSTPTPTPTPTPALSCNTHMGGFSPTSGFYIDDVSGSTVTQVKIWASRSGGSAGVHSLTLEARQCGFAGTLVGTASASANLANSGQYYEYTFNFTTFNAADCAGKKTVAFTLVNSSGETIYYSAINAANNCTMSVANDTTTTPPTLRTGNWMVRGTYSN